MVHSNLSLSYAKQIERKVHSDSFVNLRTDMNLLQSKEQKVVEVKEDGGLSPSSLVDS